MVIVLHGYHIIDLKTSYNYKDGVLKDYGQKYLYKLLTV